MLTSSPNTSSSSAITSPIWTPMRNCMIRSAGSWLVSLRHQRLHRDRGLDGADDARKLQQKAVAGVLHQPAAMIEDHRIDRAAMGLERGMRPRLVGAHHARIAGDVSADDGGQASFHIPSTPERPDSHDVAGLPNPMLIRQVVIGGSPIPHAIVTQLFMQTVDRTGRRIWSSGGHGTCGGRFRGCGTVRDAAFGRAGALLRAGRAPGEERSCLASTNSGSSSSPACCSTSRRGRTRPISSAAASSWDGAAGPRPRSGSAPAAWFTCLARRSACPRC